MKLPLRKSSSTFDINSRAKMNKDLETVRENARSESKENTSEVKKLEPKLSNKFNIRKIKMAPNKAGAKKAMPGYATTPTNKSILTNANDIFDGESH